MKDWVVKDSLETLRQAAARLQRAGDTIERNAEEFANGEISLSQAMAFSANEVSNAILDLRLDKFVMCTARAGDDATRIGR